jgi:hypothetical protein
MPDVAPQRAIATRRGVLSSPALTLDGWVEFDLPRTVTAFLFPDENADAFMVALTRRTPERPKQRSAIMLCGRGFLSGEQRDRAVSRRSSIASRVLDDGAEIAADPASNRH